MESITSFFFNIVPGALLILVIKGKTTSGIIGEISRESSIGELNIFWLIILSIFIGFLFQFLTKLLKEKLLYNIVWNRIKNDDKKRLDSAKIILKEKGLLFRNIDHEKYLEDMFYTMDNYISLNPGRLLPHFASRLAYWSNIFWLSTTIIILVIVQYINDVVISVCAVLTLIISAWASYMHLKNHYDILLKSFVSFINIDKKKIKI